MNGPLELLLLQPSPFCNIACDYCYLPHRALRGRMSLATLRQALRLVRDRDLLGPRLEVVWHGGEPLTVPIGHYEEGVSLIRAELPAGVETVIGLQTNGLLLDDRWCGLIAREGLRIGLSLDGPARLHDARRRTRSGAGTHAAVMAAVRRLQEWQIPFRVIAVLTRESLAAPDELLDFFIDHGIRAVGFNVEEIEGVNRSSSLAPAAVERELAAFWERVIDRVRAAPHAIRLREIDRTLAMLRDSELGRHPGNAQNRPLGILSVAHDGALSTFSPELLGLKDDRYGDFLLGHLDALDLDRALAAPAFRRMSEEIAAGRRACAESCAWFAFCRGGAPANKLAERGSFAATETMACRLAEQVVADAVLRALEGGFRPPLA